ncbi:TonB-dependent receptor domain-containing protein [candidate division KSB1 bacterium]
MSLLKLLVPVFFVLLIASDNYAQNYLSNLNGTLPGYLNKPITIEMENVPFSEVLNYISFRTGVDISYNNKSVPYEQLISVKAENTPVIEILMNITHDTNTGISFTSNGHIIIVSAQGNHGTISGIVTDKETGISLDGINILVSGTETGTSTGNDGEFALNKLPPGIYEIDISAIGYKTENTGKILLKRNGTVKLHIELENSILLLEEIIVTAGHYSFKENTVAPGIVMQPESITKLPGLGNDIFRGIQKLPGINSGDFSSRFKVRGGNQRETLILLDGLELYDPFHVKDYGGIISMIDDEAVGEINIYTGAFTAEFGDRLSGVVDIKSAAPSFEDKIFSASLGTLYARFLTSGSFANKNGSWLSVFRRNYFDEMPSFTNEMQIGDYIKPRYQDMFTKFQYTPSPSHLLKLNILLGQDKFNQKKSLENTIESLLSEYNDTYAWFTWDAEVNKDISFQTIISSGRTNTVRNGAIDTMFTTATYAQISENRSTSFSGLKQDWNINFSNRILLKFGFETRNINTEYDYFASTNFFVSAINDTSSSSHANVFIMRDTTNHQVRMKQTGRINSAYISNKIKLTDPCTIEIGLRFDNADWTGNQSLSPRMNIAYQQNEKLTFRAGFGRFVQNHGVHELNIQDGETGYKASEQSDHKVIGIEYTADSGISGRLEIFRKETKPMNSRYVNYRKQMDLVPELSRDRFLYKPEYSIAKGIELYFNKDTHSTFNWSCSYSYSIAKDKLSNGFIPCDFSQLHSFSLDAHWRFGNNWNLSTGWQYHSGWPYTEDRVKNIEFYTPMYTKIVWEHGPLNAKRLPAYHRMDVKISKSLQLFGMNSSMYFEILNLYNRKNVRSYDTSAELLNYNSYRLNRVEQYWLKFFPSFGAKINF